MYIIWTSPSIHMITVSFFKTLKNRDKYKTIWYFYLVFRNYKITRNIHLPIRNPDAGNMSLVINNNYWQKFVWSNMHVHTYNVYTDNLFSAINSSHIVEIQQRIPESEMIKVLRSRIGSAFALKVCWSHVLWLLVAREGIAECFLS